MGGLFQCFPEPDTERAFLRAERTERGQAIRALIVIAIATLASYIVINPMHFPREGVIAYTQAAGAFAAALLGFFFLTRTQIYLEKPWLDLPVFVAIAGAMTWLAIVLAALAPWTGFPPHVMMMVQMAILVIFASVGFAGTFRLFLGWAIALLAIFTVWIMTRPGIADISRVYTLTNFSTFFVFALYFNWDVDRRARKVFAANKALEAERAKIEELLFNVLPQEVAARLRAGEAVADSFSDLTAIFVDLVGFSTLSKRLSPGHLVQMLNTFFSAADRCAERHGIEKVKTIGDAYMAVIGGMASPGQDSKAAILFARELISDLARIAAETGLPLEARIGVHSGPAVGGVIGSARLTYDYWGDTMNIASRLQSVAPVGGVAVSAATWFQTRAMQEFEQQLVVLKGIGETEIYVADLSGRTGNPA
ncbi:adenylate/guanylate cyclase domain-containing protein [Allosphingosinicella sp.]|uniref:adenylate/guanylate cyclase domain-containing protein n=1 Tax=Allosphingosinicella sp. TaxID=2823234 RepID=UPI0037851082